MNIIKQYFQSMIQMKIKNQKIYQYGSFLKFGELINFYEFFSDEYNLVNEKKNIYILREVKKLRNAVAHNSCVLSDLGSKDNHFRIDPKVMDYLIECEIGKKTRVNKLSNIRIRQITYTLYIFNDIVTSVGIKHNIREEINKLFFERINYHQEYYTNNELLKSVYLYFKKIIEKL